MCPTAPSTAAELGSGPGVFLAAVRASCAFPTPTGHHNNTLIPGQGGFRSGAYWRPGLPLGIRILAVSIPVPAWGWPL